MSLLAKALKQQQALPDSQRQEPHGFLFDGRHWLARALLLVAMVLLVAAGLWAWPSVSPWLRIQASPVNPAPVAAELQSEPVPVAKVKPEPPRLPVQADPFLAARPRPAASIEALPPPVPAEPVTLAPASLPAIHYTGHFYASEPALRWVRMNGKKLMEGDELAPGVTLMQIGPQGVEMAFGQQRQWLNSLTDWPLP